MLDPARMDDVLRRGAPDVATLVEAWRGFDGGQEARDALDRFFGDVAGRCR